MSVRIFSLPDLGEGLTEAEVVGWSVAPGDTIAVDEIVATVETAKASVEVPCPFGGIVSALHGEIGESLAVGAPLVSVEVAGEPGSTPTEEQYREEEKAGSGNVLIGYGTRNTSSTRRRRAGRGRSRGTRPVPPGPVLTVAFGERVDRPEADRPALVAEESAPDGSGSGVGGADVSPAVTDGDDPSNQAHRPGSDAPGVVATGADGRAIRVISPLVRRLAAERGVDLRTLAPSAVGGIITRHDVEARADAALDACAPSRPVSPAVGPGAPSSTVSAGRTRIPLTGVRRIMADKVSRSRREIPDATTWVDVDATALLELKTQVQAAAPDAGIGLMALLARICVAGLARYPELNASVDVERQEIVRHGVVDLSFAAQSPRGLLVPVVNGADSMRLRELATALSELTAAARAGSLSPSQLSGGTFTLNNYGRFGVDGSTPIINHPEAAMLGIGRIIERPWVVDGQLAVRHVAQLSFTFDHRVADGADAGGFLRYVADCVERPGILLADL